MTDWRAWQTGIRSRWDEGEFAAAAALARHRLLGSVPVHQVHELSRFIEKVEAPAGWSRLPVAILRTYTVEPLLPFLRARCFTEQMLLEPCLGPFGQLEQAILGDAIRLEGSRAVLIFWRLEDLSPALTTDFLRQEPHRLEQEIATVAGRLEGIIRSVRARTSGYVVLGAASLGRMPSLGFVDRVAGSSQLAAIDALNARLREIAIADGSTLLIEEEHAMRGVPRFDPLMWTTARLPYTTAALDGLARAYAAVLRAAAGRSRKCAVVDLDNTLWKGIVGDDGLSGIGLDVAGEGLGYRDLHAYLRELQARGILLAIASKNDRETALAVLRSHPHTLLRESDFAATEIHWDDKATSLRRIAAKLNLGLDALVYLDDSEFECALIERELPEVLTICAPGPYAAIDLLEQLRPFDALSFTPEDAARTEQYRQQSAREELKTSSATLDEFLASLAMTVQPESVGPGHPSWNRVVQLINKTNQFNLTGERVAPERLQDVLRGGGEIHAFSVRDRFGDSGVVAVTVLARQGPALVIDIFVMSCRVIGRRIEEAILAVAARRASELGCTELRGRYRPTERNAIVADLYPRLGFRPVEGAEGEWTLPLPSDLHPPEVMTLLEGSEVGG